MIFDSYYIQTGDMHHTFLPDIRQPVSVAILDETIFWTIERASLLFYTNKLSLNEFKKMSIDTGRSTLERMHLLAMTPRIFSKHPCKVVNGGCSHICVATGAEQMSCLCPLGMIFDNLHRNKTCIGQRSCEYR